MKIILFDGVCNFCNDTVNFILKRDKQHIFRVVPQQGEKGGLLLEQHGKTDSMLKTIVLIDDDEWLEGMEAVIGITRELKGYVWLSRLLRIIPLKISNVLYAFVAKNRYRWFGKRESCRLPVPDEQQWFL